MLYFVKEHQLHRYPVSKRCKATHLREPLRDTVPLDVEQCAYCMNIWPGDKE